MHHSDIIACFAKVGGVEQVAAAGERRDQLVGNNPVHFVAKGFMASQPRFTHLERRWLSGNQPVQQLNRGLRLQAGKENTAFGLTLCPLGHGVDKLGAG